MENNTLPFEKRTILITGASSGIGAATAVELSSKYRLILCGRNKTHLLDILNSCKGSNHLIWQFDFSDPGNIEESLSNFIKENKLIIHGLAYCAGMIKYIPVKQFSVKEFENIFRVNVIGAAMLLKILVSKKHNMCSLKSAVFVSSNISNFGAKAHGLYSASKSALDGLMRSAAVELGPKVRVNSVLPGGVHTPMTENIFNNQQLLEKMEASYPLGLGKPNDIAKVIAFLLSDESKWITGQQITVDGGRNINLSV